MTQELNLELRSLASQAGSIKEDRKTLLDPLIRFILERQRKNEAVKLNFICTHNARRSHMAQLWASAAAMYNDLDNIDCYSGGTVVTRIHPHAIASLERSGFRFSGLDEGDNPRFLVDLGEAVLLEVFSKTYDDEYTPAGDFAAVMVCSAAEQNCPFVAGATKRMAITYADPKDFDSDPDPIAGYLSRSREIGTEMLFVMREVSKGL